MNYIQSSLGLQDSNQGSVFPLDSGIDQSRFQLYFEHPNGKLYLGDSLAWLKSLPSESVDLIFADPPYNLSKAEWDNFDSQEEYIQWSIQWIKEASRILQPQGTMYVCGFSEIPADLKHPSMKYFKSCRWIIWHYKNKANLGNDWGRSHESILHLRKAHKAVLNEGAPLDKIKIEKKGIREGGEEDTYYDVQGSPIDI
jgi:DNA modification methylase